MSQTDHDPITAEVINMAMQDIVNEMGITVERTSGSPGATDAKDYSCVLARPDGSTIAYFGNNLQHLGDSLTGSRAIAAAFPAEDIRDGDVFVYNDPFSAGALHQADVALQTPVFHGGELVGWVFTNIHMADIGGMSASGFTPESRDLYSEGLRVPPIKIVDGGVDNTAVWRLVEANVRTPIVLGDIRSAIAANNVGRQRLLTLCNEYGTAELRRYLDVNERLVGDLLRRRIQNIPAGRYNALDWVEYDPFDPVKYVPIVCDLEVRPEGVLAFDFSRSGEQMPGYVNGSEGAILGSVMSVLLAALLPDFPVNAGVYGCLEVSLGEPGRITRPTEPAGVSGGHMETGPRCLRSAHRALTQAMLGSEDEWIRGRAYALGGVTSGVIVVTGHLSAGGVGHAFMLDQQALGHGALPVGDGVAFGGIDYSIAGREPDVESTEATGPVLYLWRREIADSGGAGAFRGGNTLETMFIPWLSDSAEISHSCAGAVIPTLGVAGGFPGGASYTEIYRDVLEGDLRSLPGKADITDVGERVPSKVGRIEVSPRDAIRQVMAAGAGWGDPLVRPVAVVAMDVAEGSITAEAAKNAYGVALHDDGTPDRETTKRLRTELRRARGAARPDQWDEPPAPTSPYRTAPDGVTCGYCAVGLGRTLDRWRAEAKTVKHDLYERVSSLGTPIAPSQSGFVLVEYSCPSCGTLLDTEIARDGAGVGEA